MSPRVQLHCLCLPVCLQHVPLLSETLRMLAANDLSAAAYPYAAGSQVSSQCRHTHASVVHLCTATNLVTAE